jgi:hypothetical protein
MATRRILGGYIGWRANCSLRGPSVDYVVLATPPSLSYLSSLFDTKSLK